MGFRSAVELAEKIWFRLPGHSSAVKDVFFLDVGAWLEEILLRMARSVASSQDYRLLQRTFTFDLMRRERARYCDWSDTLLRDGSSFISTGAGVALTEQRVEPVSGKLRSVTFEFQMQGSTAEQAWGLFPLDRSPVLSGAYGASDAVVLLAHNPTNPTPLTLWQNQVQILNFGGVLFQPGHFVRLEFNADGAAHMLLLDAGRNLYLTQSLGAPNNDWTDVTASVRPGILALNSGAAIGELSVIFTGAQRSVSLDTCPPLLLQALYINGSVEFPDGTPLSRVTSRVQRTQPRLCGEWYWTLDGESLVIFPGDPDDALVPEALSVTGVVIPNVSDFPRELNEYAILAGLEIARERQADLRSAAEDERRRRSGNIPKNPDATRPA